jgi:mercuric ion transport protein
MVRIDSKQSLVAGVLAALGASVCCVGPLLLVTLGVGGAWIGTLVRFEPYRPIFVGLTVLFFGVAYWRLYRDRACDAGASCGDPRTLRRQRITFWSVAMLVSLLIATPSLAPWFY